ncbi:outer membrane beta-barrel protein [Hymenobacter terrestris]|uniref:Outer membrane beta-barrel protein n=1 Tax=Hymenobacter terrestris TaxID=2748310 RepID=A0ABX2Q5L0_9BACT|nr:outer membrane beta-barrel protein [Hymenobacter terrestris]NVO86253.1 outer membrane beta-barrel protein [Hymenobacter terrestris]
MKHLFIPLFLLGSASCAQGQTSISAGPVIGFNTSTAPYKYDHTFTTHYRTGGAIGALANIQRQHLALQVVALYQQKGFRIDDAYTSPNSLYTRQKNDYRLNYLNVPVQVAYAFRPDGQGLQVFAGGYAGLLLGGKAELDTYYEDAMSGASGVRQGTMKLEPGRAPDPSSIHSYSQRIDAGLQAGAGYRCEQLLLQLSYSYGLRDAGPRYEEGIGDGFITPSYYNRVAQVSVAYLFGHSE